MRHGGLKTKLSPNSMDRVTPNTILRVLDSALSPKAGKPLKLSETLAGLQRAVDAVGGPGAASNVCKNVVGTIQRISALAAHLDGGQTATGLPAIGQNDQEILQSLTKSIDGLCGPGTASSIFRDAGAASTNAQISALAAGLESLVSAMASAALGMTEAPRPARPGAAMGQTPKPTATTAKPATPAVNAFLRYQELLAKPGSNASREASEFYSQNADEICRQRAVWLRAERETLKRQRGF